MKKDFLIPILVLSLICLLMSGALAAGHSITRPVIEEAAAERAEAARMEIIPNASAFVLIPPEGLPGSVVEAYSVDGGQAGFLFTVVTTGYGGKFTILCGVGPDGRILKTKVLAHSETQGLGTVVFDQKAPEYEGKDADHISGIDAVAGSTITSKAYKQGVEDAFKAYEIVKGARP